jgi:hypothetical protein
MTEPIVCREGKCDYKDKRLVNALEDCIDCDLSEQIEHDLLKEMVPDN